MPGVDLLFDTIAYKNFPVVVLNWSTSSALLSWKLGGIVGHKFLNEMRVGIDLRTVGPPPEAGHLERQRGGKRCSTASRPGLTRRRSSHRYGCGARFHPSTLPDSTRSATGPFASAPAAGAADPDAPS